MTEHTPQALEGVPPLTPQNIDTLLDKVALAFCRLKAIDSVTEEVPASDTLTIQFEEWDWEVGVGLYGFWKLAQQRGDGAMLAALAQWYEQKLQAGLPPRQINSTAPMLVLALLCRDDPRPHWLQAVEEWADWLLHSLPKTEDGGFQHTVKERPNTGQLWDDTLFMAGLFLVVSAGVLNRQALQDEAEYQLLTHARYLADAPSGLWYHGWTFLGRHHYAGAFWGRGNAWVTLVLPEICWLAQTPLSPPVQRTLEAILTQQTNALAACQHHSGLWHTLLNDPDSPLETSASAGFIAGILNARRLGMLADFPAEVLEKGLAAVVAQIDPQGVVQGVSDGTAMGHDLQFYHDIPNVAVPYGQALVMLMLLAQRHSV
ncbi:glycoside hydrolase family 88/105 protein [Dickeya lacustris]|uniref:Glycoside hydrolase family 88 protein n=1 Tax=Dickeya lacustris TaxID=2259638 RepID=A0ABY8G4S1_9GAMM|nr:glycoside hydrolase family 88 protein [Dickeya lacustris]WFN54922.1 glycoside hydrolase family 88 protein [Dickeya lacustris]